MRWDEYRSIQSFVIKAILEGDLDGSTDSAWRGYVTHIASGDRHPWRTLREITEFIQHRLTQPDAESEGDGTT